MESRTVSDTNSAVKGFTRNRFSLCFKPFPKLDDGTIEQWNKVYFVTTITARKPLLQKSCRSPVPTPLQKPGSGGLNFLHQTEAVEARSIWVYSFNFPILREGSSDDQVGEPEFPRPSSLVRRNSHAYHFAYLKYPKSI